MRALCIVAPLALAAACHRQAPVSESSPVAATETPCWWTVYRSELPLDTVGVHFVNAFSALGLTGATWVRQGDTAWASAGPTRLAARFGGTFSARAVAFQRGDSTLYRYFVTAAPPPGGWGHGYDSVTVTGGHISVVPAASALGLCASVASTVRNGGKAPKAPNGEETLAIWSSRPAARPATTQVLASIDLRPVDPANADSIVLERTPCFGVCTAYRLRIARSGEVLYQSRARGDTTHWLTTITTEQARHVFQIADLLQIDALPDTIEQDPAYCRNPGTDSPTATTTVYVGSASKHVVDYLGCDWAPVGLRRLEGMIDSVAGASRRRDNRAER